MHGQNSLNSHWYNSSSRDEFVPCGIHNWHLVENTSYFLLTWQVACVTSLETGGDIGGTVDCYQPSFPEEFACSSCSQYDSIITMSTHYYQGGIELQHKTMHVSNTGIQTSVKTIGK